MMMFIKVARAQTIACADIVIDSWPRAKQSRQNMSIDESRRIAGTHA